MKKMADDIGIPRILPDSITASRVVLVTGGTRGIGRAISEAFASRGDIVVLGFLKGREDAERVLGTLRGSGHSLAQGDVSDPDTCRRIVEEVVVLHGRLDVLVNNSAVFIDSPPLESSFEEWTNAWRRQLDVNVLGPACLSWAAAQVMSRNGGGAIVNVSSRGAKRGEPTAPGYGSSKAALNSMTQCLAQALGHASIAVSAVAPGFTETDMAKEVLEGARGPGIRAQSPFNRVAAPDEIARVVLFLADPKSKWLSGSVVDLNGASYFH